jgi:glycosyltransferase involved in cell wall biosynthesis
LGLAWEQLVLPIALRRHPVDVFHAPANRGVPLAGGARFVGSINDVIPLVTPFFFDGQPDPPLTTWLYRVIHWVALSIVAWRSARIITLSQHSRQDIERLFPRARGKVVVIYPGADPRYRRVTDRQVLMQTKERYGLPDRFILYVGGLGQRKNLAGLLQAYALLALRRPETPPLVVVGKRNALYEPLVEETKTLSLAGRVIFPGFIPTDHLPALLSIAELLVYPSFYEGFGLPVVEAMSCGCPVVCSDTSSLPEVGGDGVLYCNPSDPQDIADHMEQVLVNPQLRETLIGKGIAQARRFSVEQMLDATLQVYREVFREGGSA